MPEAFLWGHGTLSSDEWFVGLGQMCAWLPILMCPGCCLPRAPSLPARSLPFPHSLLETDPSPLTSSESNRLLNAAFPSAVPSALAFSARMASSRLRASSFTLSVGLSSTSYAGFSFFSFSPALPHGERLRVHRG